MEQALASLIYGLGVFFGFVALAVMFLGTIGLGLALATAIGGDGGEHAMLGFAFFLLALPAVFLNSDCVVGGALRVAVVLADLLTIAVIVVLYWLTAVISAMLGALVVRVFRPASAGSPPSVQDHAGIAAVSAIVWLCVLGFHLTAAFSLEALLPTSISCDDAIWSAAVFDASVILADALSRTAISAAWNVLPFSVGISLVVEILDAF